MENETGGGTPRRSAVPGRLPRILIPIIVIIIVAIQAPPLKAYLKRRNSAKQVKGAA